MKIFHCCLITSRDAHEAANKAVEVVLNVIPHTRRDRAAIRSGFRVERVCVRGASQIQQTATMPNKALERDAEKNACSSDWSLGGFDRKETVYRQSDGC